MLRKSLDRQIDAIGERLVNLSARKEMRSYGNVFKRLVQFCTLAAMESDDPFYFEILGDFCPSPKRALAFYRRAITLAPAGRRWPIQIGMAYAFNTAGALKEVARCLREAGRDAKLSGSRRSLREMSIEIDRFRRVTAPVSTLKGLLDGVTPENAGGEIDSGPPVGQEVW
jgi:hypothetical protein